MLKLRLKRIGRRHDPSFRVVVTENTTPPKGKYLEVVGFYNASLKQLKLNTERIKYWLGVGIQPTDTVHNLLVKEGILTSKKRPAHSTRVRKKEEAKEEVKKEKVAEISDTIKDLPKDTTSAETKEASKEVVESEPKEESKGEDKSTED